MVIRNLMNFTTTIRDNLRKGNVPRFLLMAAMMSACLWMEYYIHIVHGIPIVYTHLFYLPIFSASYWWGLKGGLCTGLFLGLTHIIISLFSLFDIAEMLRVFMFIFVGLTSGALCDRPLRAEEALKHHAGELEERTRERTLEVEGRVRELKAANETLDREIVGRKQIEKQLRETLNNREVLLSEVHHRLRNNLQVLSSLLDIDAMQTRDEDAIEALENARAKIHAMALIHSQLHEGDSIDRIDMGKHIREMTSHIARIYSEKKKVAFDVRASGIYLSIDQATSCALVLNELICNSYKHGLDTGREGTIQISMDVSGGDTVLIRFKDESRLPLTEDDLKKPKTLGMKLVRNIIGKQLKGKMQIKHDGGTEFIIEFKKQP